MVVDRKEFFSFLLWLNAFYSSMDGLQRPNGLSINGQPDFEGVAAWGFDVYLNSREYGISPTAARNNVVRAIQKSEEWQAIHTLPDTPPATIIPLRVQYNLFYAGVKPWRYKGVSMFRAAERFGQGEDLTPLVEWTRQVGANTWRVFLQAAWMSPLPLTTVADFIQWTASQGIYVELVVLADSEGLKESYTFQRERLIEVLELAHGKPNVLVEWTNEPGVHDFSTKPETLVQLNRDIQWHNYNVLQASGDYDEISRPNLIRLDYWTDHPQRKPSWPAEAGKTAHFINDGWDGFRGFKGAVVADEPIKLGPGYEMSVENVQDGGAGWGISGAGATAHTQSGIDASLPNRDETLLVAALFSAMDFFPTDAPGGDYTHDGLTNHPLAPTREAGEVVARIVATNQAYVVAAQPTGQWRAEPINGWRVERVYNERGNILWLTR